MRTFLLISNVFVGLVFSGFFIYTIVGRQHLDSMARAFVASKTEHYATPRVQLLNEVLRSKAAQRWLAEDQASVIATEIGEYQSDPATYIRKLMAKTPRPKPTQFPSKPAELFYKWKEGMRVHYNKVLMRLIIDLRIFSGSNVVAAIIAFGCAYRIRGGHPQRLTYYSLLLLVSVGYAVYFYIDEFSFFSILFDSYLGWWYPALIILFFGHFLFRFRHALRAASPTDHARQNDVASSGDTRCLSKA